MNKKLIILGGGESGTGAAILAKKQGYDVFVSDAGVISEKYKSELDQYHISYEKGGHSFERILAADEVVKSPGIPDKNEMVKAIRNKAIPVISEIEFAYRFKGNSKIIAITGSNGKSTTTSLINHMFITAELPVAMVGNIGISFAKQVALDPQPWYVAEISSFQLDDIINFRADVAVLLNITEDHLDRYEYKIENYIRSKFRIVENQTKDDYFIYNLDDEVTMKYINDYLHHSNPLPFSMKQEPRQGAYIKDEQMLIKVKEEEMKMSIHDFALKGKHNQYNTMAAGIAAAVIDIRKEKIRDAVTSFESLEHRMELVLTIKGVEYINDSKATNINSTWYALESMNKPVVLILGGVDKGNDYSLIEELVEEKVKAIICLGLDNKNIHAAFDGKVASIEDTITAEDAVNAAYKLATKGDVVLLSPACASFDLFKNYEDRGHQFSRAVKNL
ncbi:MAG: UDP-N-acetylmuramoyl-L-alanine--D-glutamate ligase [Bacteroidota bacterium]